MFHRNINYVKDKLPFIYMEFQFENIRETLYLKYLNNLKTGSNKLLINLDKLNSKINDLSVINTNSETFTEKNIITEKNLLSESTDYLFLKQWSKLNKIHKIIKIKEFIKTLECNQDDKEQIQDEIIEIVKNFNKFKITYDEKKGRIISIPTLTFSNGKYKLNLC